VEALVGEGVDGAQTPSSIDGDVTIGIDAGVGVGVASVSRSGILSTLMIEAVPSAGVTVTTMGTAVSVVAATSPVDVSPINDNIEERRSRIGHQEKR
jgi:hypothetical protein